jgi:arylsulfatase A-like enzyme
MSTARPNIVCIVADDLGWRDLGCYGSGFYETPRLDALVREGTRFSDAYAASPVCSPTRASLQTGQYPARVGVTDWIDARGGGTHPVRGKLTDAPYEGSLPAETETLAECLGDAGYSTCHVGKWHLGGAKQDALPTDCGFDRNVGGCEVGLPPNGYFAPWDIPTLDETEEEREAERYLSDRLGEEAAAFVEEAATDSDPFFLNYNPYLVHTPLEAPADIVKRYERKRQRLGLDEVEEVRVDDRFPTEHKRDRRIKRRLVQSHPTYAAMVEALDRNVGRVLDALERTGQLENTIVVFTSDNGGLATAEGSPTTNRPLRNGKGWMHEGGNRVPLVVRWPGVTDDPDAVDVCEDPVVTPDLYPTLLDAADATPPSDQPTDGVDLRPVLAGGRPDRDAVFWHYPHYGNQGGTPASAVRAGDWKLVEFFEDDHVELYHLGEDVRETHDLSDHRPEKVTELRERLEEWRDRIDADYPTENPAFEAWDDRAGF